LFRHEPQGSISRFHLQEEGSSWSVTAQLMYGVDSYEPRP
jgi:hypothetical protein